MRTVAAFVLLEPLAHSLSTLRVITWIGILFVKREREPMRNKAIIFGTLKLVLNLSLREQFLSFPQCYFKFRRVIGLVKCSFLTYYIALH